MEFNQAQITSFVRWLITTFGGAIAGFFVAKGWLTSDTVMGILNSPTFLGIVVSGIGLVWGWLTHTKTAIVAAANALPEVAGVITQPTAAGTALANAVPANTVAPAGSSAAKAVAGT